MKLRSSTDTNLSHKTHAGVRRPQHRQPGREHRHEPLSRPRIRRARAGGESYGRLCAMLSAMQGLAERDPRNVCNRLSVCVCV